MSKLLNHSLRKIILFAGIVLAFSIPVYYFAIERLLQFEMAEHKIMLSSESAREDALLIVGTLTLLSAIFFVVMMGGLILINRWLSRRVWQPFYKSLEQIKAFDLNKTDLVKLDRSGIAEFDELNTSLEKLIEGNISAFTRQKEFADNASHELQTPIAIVQSKLELLSQSDLQEQQYQLIEDAMSALSRASRINKNLLLLTKIENSQFTEREEINGSQLIPALIEEMEPFFDAKDMKVEVDLSNELKVTGNRTLLQLMVSNLITNGIRYSEPGSIMHIRSQPNMLEIRNPGSSSLDKSQLFKRFAKVNANNPGTGLGLAIVREICKHHNWSVDYAWKDAKHIFQVLFH